MKMNRCEKCGEEAIVLIQLLVNEEFHGVCGKCYMQRNHIIDPVFGEGDDIGDN